MDEIADFFVEATSDSRSIAALVDAIRGLGQPELLESEVRSADLDDDDPQGVANAGELETGAMVAPVSLVGE